MLKLTTDVIGSSGHDSRLLPDLHVLALQVALGFDDGEEGAVLQLGTGGFALFEALQGEGLQVAADKLQVLVGAVP